MPSAAPAPSQPKRLRTVVVAGACALLAACQTAPPAPFDAGVPPRERYASDLQACRDHVDAGDAGVLVQTLDLAVQGALVAAMLAWSGGGDADTVSAWALGGAAMTGTAQGLQALAQRRQAVARCMLARGHGQGPAPYSTALPAAVPAAPAASVMAYAPYAAPVPTGADAFSAERLARTQACNAQPRAVLAAKGPGYEQYTVACSNGDALAIRCEFGNCRVLR